MARITQTQKNTKDVLSILFCPGSILRQGATNGRTRVRLDYWSEKYYSGRGFSYSLSSGHSTIYKLCANATGKQTHTVPALKPFADHMGILCINHNRINLGIQANI